LSSKMRWDWAYGPQTVVGLEIFGHDVRERVPD